MRPSTGVTMRDVARAAGVSTALVSIVLRDVPGASEANRQLVRETARRLGYRIDERARLLSRKRSQLIGVAFGAHHPFHGEMLDALYAATADTGFDVYLSPVTARRDERTAIGSLLDHRCESLVLLGPSLRRPDLAALAELVPVTVVARSVPGGVTNVVRTDDVRGARTATEHLIALGHTDIVLADGGSQSGASERRRGYRRAMGAAGLTPRSVPSGTREHDGERSAELLLESARTPTAVIAFNDHCAVGIINTLRRAHRLVPEDVSVVGYDDIQAAGLRSVGLTTIAQDVDQLASLAIGRAITSANGHRAITEDVVEPRLVVRETTQALDDTGAGAAGAASRRATAGSLSL